MRNSLIHHLDRLATDRWARHGVRSLLRAAWLSVCIWCIGLGGHMLWGWSLRYDLLGVLALLLIGGAVALLLRPKLRPLEVARRLDRRFHLDEQLATAVEVAGTQPARDSVAGRLVAESVQTAAQLQRRLLRRQSLPWSEVIALAALALVMVGLYVLNAIGQPDLDLSAASLNPPPPLVQPKAAPQEQQEPPPDSVQQPDAPQPGQAGEGNQPDPQALGALADALREQGATRPAAEALDQGDLAGAAQQLRELADQANQLSQSARNDLAERLREAARQLEDRDPQLADQLRDSAAGLERGGQSAAQALDELARAIEQLQPEQDGQQGQSAGEAGNQPQPGGQGEAGQQGQDAGAAGEQGSGDGQGAGAGGAGNGAAGEQRQSPPSSRLGVEGQPLPLEADGKGQKTEGSNRKPTSAVRVPGTTQGGGGQTSQGASGADPLRIPVDERNVVQDYFTP